MRQATRIRHLHTAGLSTARVREIRALLGAAFGTDPGEAFTDHDWEHALGGRHVVADRAGRLIGHAALVPRELHVAGHALRTGYVEAVAVAPDEQGGGIGTLMMGEVNRLIADGFEIGALGTGSFHFYERLGWERWRGPSSVRTRDCDRPTPAEDGYILVLRTPSTAAIDLDAPISCEWRAGDVW